MFNIKNCKNYKILIFIRYVKLLNKIDMTSKK